MFVLLKGSCEQSSDAPAAPDTAGGGGGLPMTYL